MELFKMAMQNPLSFVIVSLCVVTLSLHLGLFEVKVAIAEISKQQEFDSYINDKVLDMSESLIRIDENVKYMKENQMRVMRDHSSET